MSDFLFSSRALPAGELRAVLARWLGPASPHVAEYAGHWGTVAVARLPLAPDPVREDEHGLTVLAGEPLARFPGLAAGAAASPPRRDRVHRALLEGRPEGWADQLDGQFAALALRAATPDCMALTDLFAWIPIFAADGAAHLLLGTHADAVAEAAGARGVIDPVAAAELLGYYAITYPRTLYPGVTQLAPGTATRFARGRRSGEDPYWSPVERTPYASVDEAAEVLRAALVTDVGLAVAEHPRAGVLLSGGEDSRAVLGALPPGTDAQGFVFAASDNREVRSARRVARAYGIPLRFGPRPPTHDLDHIEDVATLIGTQHQFFDAHGYALHASLEIDRFPVVLGGFSSDVLLKAEYLRGDAWRRVLRGERPGRAPVEPPPLPGVRDELLREAARRLEHFRKELERIRPVSGVEWSYLYPFSMRRAAAGVHGNRRLFRSHEPFMSNPVARLSAEVPQPWKVRRLLFHRAVRPLLARSWYVPHTRNRLPYFGNAVNRIARPLLGAVRGARALSTGRLGTHQESWPVWADLVRTPEMEARVRSAPLRESPLAELFHEPGAADAIVRRWPPFRRLIALQLALLFRR